MLRLLDSNVFITAKNTYYALDLVPAFWSWLDEQARAGTIASTDLVYAELRDGNDELADWVRDHRTDLFRVNSSSSTVATHVASLGTWARSESYADHVIADFMDCADPFLVGAAAEMDFTVVTLEIPAGSKRKKVKIPDACTYLGVRYEDTFAMMRGLGARFA